MKSVAIRPNVYPVGAQDWNRRLFDQLIPLPDGTSYNSYLVRGSSKTALIDTVYTTKKQVLMRHLEQMGVNTIDYVIANHAEQDHSGALPHVLDCYPMAKAVCSPKCKGMLVDLLLAPEDKIITVADRETISLGDKTLEFIYFPWVHWPETMLTYLRQDRILFTCDLFGSHLATTDLFVADEGQVYEAAKRYYAEIMMPFHTNIQRDIVKLDSYAIDLIATSHGPIYDKPKFILDAYRDWVSDEPKNMVVVPYVSMYGSTRSMVDRLVEALAERDVPAKEFDLAVTDIGKLAMALVDAATVIIGTPTTLAGAHPLAVYAAYLCNALRPKAKYISIIGSYGWGGRMVEQLSGMISSLKVEVLPPVIARGCPREADFKALENLANAIAERHKGLARPLPLAYASS